MTRRSTFDGCTALACQGDGMCALASASGTDSRTTQEYGSRGMQWEVVHMAAAPSAVRSCSAGSASSAISTSYGATCRRQARRGYWSRMWTRMSWPALHLQVRCHGPCSAST